MFVENSWSCFGINQPSGRAQLKWHHIPNLVSKTQKMFLKLMLSWIVEVLSNVLVLISQVAALNWSDTIYPNLGYPRQKRRKSTFLHEKWSERILSISDVPYVENRKS